MRLWHQALIPYLDNKRLLAQHRECCALRGLGWGKKHATVDYVFKYTIGRLYSYHLLVMHEMLNRDYVPLNIWYNRLWRGNQLGMSTTLQEIGITVYTETSVNVIPYKQLQTIYPEHNDKYLRECLLNLKAKGAELINGKTIDQMLIELDLEKEQFNSLQSLIKYFH